MQLFYHRGALAEQVSDWKTACQHYEASRKTAMTFFAQNRENILPANFYVMTGVSLCRSHEKNGSPKLAQTVAEQTIESAKGFPKTIAQNEAFADNMKILKALIPAAGASR